jgi:hypothetical protein
LDGGRVEAERSKLLKPVLVKSAVVVMAAAAKNVLSLATTAITTVINLYSDQYRKAVTLNVTAFCIYDEIS